MNSESESGRAVGGGLGRARRRRTLSTAAIVLAAALLAVAATPGAARAAVGVMSASQRTAAPGEEVRVTLGCGFCFPPCKGPKGERHPEGFDHGACMLGTHGAPPPRSFSVSLVARSAAPRPHRCGPGAVCAPVRRGPPRKAPYSYLGLAIPPPGGNDPRRGAVPRYSLAFEVPHLAPGTYAYVIWCDACAAGRGGSLVTDPHSRRWRLRVTRAGKSRPASSWLPPGSPWPDMKGGYRR